MKAKIAGNRIQGTSIRLQGFVNNYLRGITEQWLLVAPKANPAMLEMFRDRDIPPFRDMVPWAGEFAGKYLTAALQVLRVTGDADLKSWLKEFVSQLMRFQDKDGYLGPWPINCRLTNKNFIGGDTWDTWGHYHIMLGLILWNEESGDKRALTVAIKIADLICKKFLGKKKPRLVETGSTEMNMAPVHALCMLYRKTKKEKYLKMALQLVDEFAAKNKKGYLAGDYLNQPLAGKEFFETPKPRWESLHPIMALAELHWVTGEATYRLAFERTWHSIVKFDRHNNGGFTSGEKATGNPYDPAPIESCCTIAWLAMSVEMLKLTMDSKVADEIELSTLNSVVGMHSATGRWATYNTPMEGIRSASAHHISFQAREASPELNCCSVNTPRGFGLISEWALMKDHDGLVLNYYGPGEMVTKLKRDLSITIIQETKYPVEGKILIRINPTKKAEFKLKLRIPKWSEKTSVKVNEKTIPHVSCGQYLEIDREWKSGDNIELSLDMSFHFWKGKKNFRGKVSVYRGPILLTYDNRYNPGIAVKHKKIMRKTANVWEPKLTSTELSIPQLDLSAQKGKIIQWNDWFPPVVLLEFNVGQQKVRLCDFGSAGETGTPYSTWLPVKNFPDKKISAFSVSTTAPKIQTQVCAIKEEN